jgi:hypothetical protein
MLSIKKPVTRRSAGLQPAASYPCPGAAECPGAFFPSLPLRTATPRCGAWICNPQRATHDRGRGMSRRFLPFVAATDCKSAVRSAGLQPTASYPCPGAAACPGAFFPSLPLRTASPRCGVGVCNPQQATHARGLRHVPALSSHGCRCGLQVRGPERGVQSVSFRFDYLFDSRDEPANVSSIALMSDTS